jgi:RNA polymerase-binding transcription factor DksA
MTSAPVPVAPRAPTLNTNQLGTDQLAGFRAMLEQQRDFRLDQLRQLTDRAQRPTAAAVERDITRTLIMGAEVALHDVLDALQRMDDGSYGTCRACGTLLAVERLEILPQVGICLPCQHAQVPA